MILIVIKLVFTRYNHEIAKMACVSLNISKNGGLDMFKFIWKAICLAVAVAVFLFVLGFIGGFIEGIFSVL